MPNFDDLVAQSELIVEGRVSEVLLDGLAYELDVIEAFKGPITSGVVRIGPASDPGGRGCETTLQPDSHVIVAVPEVAGTLNSLVTAVWYIASDGSLSSPGSWWELAPDADALRAMLRNAIPDTALGLPESPLSDARLGWFLATTALLLAAFRFRRNRTMTFGRFRR